MAMLPSTRARVSTRASEWRGQRAHEKVFPKRRGVLRTRQITRESHDLWDPGVGGNLYLINTSELDFSQPNLFMMAGRSVSQLPR